MFVLRVVRQAGARKMGRQKIHTRRSKYGIKFVAGRKPKIQKLEETIFDAGIGVHNGLPNAHLNVSKKITKRKVVMDF